MKNYKIKIIFSFFVLFLILISCSSKKDISYYDEQINKNPNDPELYYKRGKLFLDNDCNKAISDFTKSIELNYEKLYLAYKSRGKCFIKLGSFDKALEDLNTSIRLNPEHADSYMERGYIYSALKEYDKSNEDFNVAYSLDDEILAAKLKIGENYFNKGTIFYNNKNLNTALEYFDKSELTFNEYYEKFTDSKKRDPQYERIIDKIDVMEFYYYDLIYLQSVTLIELGNYKEAGSRIEYLKKLDTKYNNQCDSILKIFTLKNQ